MKQLSNVLSQKQKSADEFYDGTINDSTRKIVAKTDFCIGFEKAIELVKQEEILPLDFVIWYSGMEKEKILKAFVRWKRETEETPANIMKNENIKIGVIGHIDPKIHSCIMNEIPRGIIIVEKDTPKETVFPVKNFEIEPISISERYAFDSDFRKNKKPKNEDWQNRMKQLQRR